MNTKQSSMDAVVEQLILSIMYQAIIQLDIFLVWDPHLFLSMSGTLLLIQVFLMVNLNLLSAGNSNRMAIQKLHF